MNEKDKIKQNEINKEMEIMKISIERIKHPYSNLNYIKQHE